MTRARLAGTGRWLPERVVTSAQLGELAGVDEQWIPRSRLKPFGH